MSDSVRPHRRQPTRLLHLWDSPGKNTGVGCHFLLQCMKVKSESEVAQSCPTLVTPRTAAYQAPSSTGFSRQEYWSGVPLPSPDLLLLMVLLVRYMKYLRTNTESNHYIYLGPNYGGAKEDNDDLLQKVPCTHCYTQCPQPCIRPLLTHASAGDSWMLTCKSGSLVGSLLLSPGSWCAGGSVCTHQEFVSQACVSSGGSMVGLMATSPKRAYAIPRSAAPRAPGLQARIHRTAIQKRSSQPR